MPLKSISESQVAHGNINVGEADNKAKIKPSCGFYRYIGAAR
jgi:hypothetical protein